MFWLPDAAVMLNSAAAAHRSVGSVDDSVAVSCSAEGPDWAAATRAAARTKTSTIAATGFGYVNGCGVLRYDCIDSQGLWPAAEQAISLSVELPKLGNEGTARNVLATKLRSLARGADSPFRAAVA